MMKWPVSSPARVGEVPVAGSRRERCCRASSAFIGGGFGWRVVAIRGQRPAVSSRVLAELAEAASVLHRLRDARGDGLLLVGLTHSSDHALAGAGREGRTITSNWGT